jgi:ankyrin repeat protein
LAIASFLLGGGSAYAEDAGGQHLLAAARAGDVATANALIESGADVNWKGKSDATPLIVWLSKAS